jgi:hypothetical protein
MTMHPNHPASMVMTRIGGQDYPLRSVSSCKTCQSPHRMAIENELLQARSYTSIAKSLEGLDAGHLGHPSPEGISDHVKRGHIPLPVSAKRRLIERRAKDIGRSIEESEESLADHVTLAQMVVTRGYERLVSGEIEPNLTEALAAGKFLHEVEKSVGGGVDESAWRDTLMVYLEVSRQFIPQEKWAEFSRSVGSHPVIKAMVEAQQKKALGVEEE